VKIGLASFSLRMRQFGNDSVYAPVVASQLLPLLAAGICEYWSIPLPRKPLNTELVPEDFWTP
jgi:hypothetical protein